MTAIVLLGFANSRNASSLELRYELTFTRYSDASAVPRIIVRNEVGFQLSNARLDEGETAPEIRGIPMAEEYRVR